MTTETKIPPKPLQVVTVQTDSGSVSLPCEPINDWLGITPEFYMDSDGKTWLDGTFVITHLSTGQTFSIGEGCINCCRNAGRALDALGLDWQALADDASPNHEAWTGALTDEQKQGLVVNRELAWMCDTQLCDELDGDGELVGHDDPVDGPQIVSRTSIDISAVNP